MTPPISPAAPLAPDRRRQLLHFLVAIGVLDPIDPESAAIGWPEPDLEPIDEALTHSSAGLSRNHERLEFLGDAVLRLAAAEHLQQHHPELGVGACSELRAQIVSDRWLAELGESCGIEAVLRLGPLAIGDPAGRRTIRAETCEALVGGLYEAWGSLKPVHRWLAPHWRRSIAELLGDPHRHNWKSALQEWSQARASGLPHYRSEERSQRHGDPQRFICWVELLGDRLGEGWGGSRREAEQQAARAALARLSPAPGCSEES
ncbi:ribonuclease III [Synechococcus sp. CS-1324]|uniref:ribonuclease III n=1 Tax=unclassified Synechococcus TaxID=2626047 RepID=UPI000DB3073B|nr:MULTISPECIES: ribonuclease III [unclassified Synechococcus]MCT0213115.1 ribonuclease III [Synechococcus sp. CS-1326]MCT0230917.1 ribonuclease III [Synechococcus sp. CS-1324]MCT0232933.1 ribonuclease III [Synechococcus sp. CS-1327]PZV04523.1 MAG: ribonuclease III [Cyanobium sp.]